jgi:hypothetical protein
MDFLHLQRRLESRLCHEILYIRCTHIMRVLFCVFCMPIHWRSPHPPTRYRQYCFYFLLPVFFKDTLYFLLTVDAIEVLIKYCINWFPKVDQFIRIQISFYFLCVSYWSIGSETKSRSNRKLINFLSNELINLRKGIGAIFYQHFYCIDSTSIASTVSTFCLQYFLLLLKSFYF